jgi:hypothetical protein
MTRPSPQPQGVLRGVATVTSGFAGGLDRLGSITGLRFSLVLRPPLTPTRDLGSQRPPEHWVKPCSHAAQNGP